ncbi:hypothetical protein VPH35_061705 [Triticum aestivum]|uniref:Uncharacterized protein n=2 Tax=Aegilops tauschii subsp. strangulata TaxID=200361 RepID=A0A453FZJ3_AEGTS
MEDYGALQAPTKTQAHNHGGLEHHGSNMHLAADKKVHLPLIRETKNHLDLGLHSHESTSKTRETRTTNQGSWGTKKKRRRNQNPVVDELRIAMNRRNRPPPPPLELSLSALSK